MNIFMFSFFADVSSLIYKHDWNEKFILYKRRIIKAKIAVK